jgi:hypothetical protein
MGIEEENFSADLNDVKNLESATSGVDYKYKHIDNAGILYKNLIKSLSNYSKGELFTTDDIRALIRNEYETL